MYVAGICDSRYLLLAELGQNTEETGEGSAGDSGEDHTGTQSHDCAWAWEPSVMGHWGSDAISFLRRWGHSTEMGWRWGKEEREAGSSG